jgi:hypothetical protein
LARFLGRRISLVAALRKIVTLVSLVRLIHVLCHNVVSYAGRRPLSQHCRQRLEAISWPDGCPKRLPYLLIEVGLTDAIVAQAKLISNLKDGRRGAVQAYKKANTIGRERETARWCSNPGYFFSDLSVA